MGNSGVLATLRLFRLSAFAVQRPFRSPRRTAQYGRIVPNLSGTFGLSISMSEALTTAAQTYGRSVREAVRVLSGALKQKRFYDLRGTLLPSYHFQSGLTSVRPDAEVAAWDLVSMWLTGVATNNLLTKATLREAEEWFLAKDKPPKLTDLLSAGEISEAQRALPVRGEHRALPRTITLYIRPSRPGQQTKRKA